MKRLILALCAALLPLANVGAHTEPTSFIDLRCEPAGIALTLTASTTDLAHDLPAVEPAMLLDPAILATQRAALASVIASRLDRKSVV